jgi:hypothetical protein
MRLWDTFTTATEVAQPRPVPRSIDGIADPVARQWASEAWRAGSQLYDVVQQWRYGAYFDESRPAEVTTIAYRMEEVGARCVTCLLKLKAPLGTLTQATVSELMNNFPPSRDAAKRLYMFTPDADVRAQYDKAMSDGFTASLKAGDPERRKAAATFHYCDSLSEICESGPWEQLIGELHGFLRTLEIAPSTVIHPSPAPAAVQQNAKPEHKRGRMTVKMADGRARELANELGGRFWTMSQTAQAQRIRCHLKTWKKTKFYEDSRKVKPISRCSSSPPATSFTPALEAVTEAIDDHDDGEKLARLIDEQQRERQLDERGNGFPRRGRVRR